MTLSSYWWFWALAAGGLAGAAVLSRRYRLLAWKARRSALRRGLIELPPGRGLASPRGGFWSDPSWLAFPLGIWVILSPWIWGYEDVEGAVVTDAVTGGAVIVIALAGIVFPALWALNLGAGLWLVTAPWLVGYGDANGPVGLSDCVAGLVICVTAVATMAAAQRQIRPGGGPRAIGRIRPRE